MPTYEWTPDDTRGVLSLRKVDGFGSQLIGFVVQRDPDDWEAAYWGADNHLTLNVKFTNCADAMKFVLVSARLCGM